MDSNLQLIKEIIILDPPTFYFVPYKKLKVDKDGNEIEGIKYYLTGNLFYSDAGSIFTVRKIIQECKEYLLPYLRGLPKLEKMRFEFEYHHTRNIDLDNKFSFWGKIFLDILKTPTEKQINRAIKFKNKVITTNTIPDDNTKYVQGFSVDWKRGEHKMIFRIYGRYTSEQKEMDLFVN